MPSGPATILGGLPVIADVTFTRDYYGECDASVDCLYWMKRDGSKGKPIPEHMYDRLPDYWESDVIEAVSDHIALEQWEREQCQDQISPPTTVELFELKPAAA